MNKKNNIYYWRGKRLGEMIALDFAQNGYDMALHYNNSKQKAKDLLNKLVN